MSVVTEIKLRVVSHTNKLEGSEREREMPKKCDESRRMDRTVESASSIMI